MKMCQLFLFMLLSLAAVAEASMPKVRAITAFIAIDRDNLESKVYEALDVLRKTKKAAEDAGFTVQSVRITTQPFSNYLAGLSTQQAIEFVKLFEKLATRENFDPNIGALMPHSDGNDAWAQQLGEILAATDSVKASMVVATSFGIDWQAIKAAARVVQHLKRTNANATFNFAATAMLEPYGPFFPGAYHLGKGKHFSIGLESANIVNDVFSTTRDPTTASERLAKALGKYAHTMEAIGNKIADKSGWTYAGFDPTPVFSVEAPIATAIEKLSGHPFGSSGTLTAVATVTKAIKAIDVKQIGYAGLMLPVLEDPILAKRWSDGKLSIDALLAYSAVCGTGLDTLPLPGDVSDEQLERIIGDMASLAFKWKKPLTARLQPVPGKSAGQLTQFRNPFLVNARLQPLP